MIISSRREHPVERLGRILAVLMISQQSLAAYTDPGSGTLVWQLLVGGLVGLTFELRRIKNWVSRKFRSNNPPDSALPVSND
jgi:hypothetical protein